MYKLEVYKDFELIKTIYFIVGEGLEMLQYKQQYQSKGYMVKIWKLISGWLIISLYGICNISYK